MAGQNRNQECDGFTLIELLVVISIITLLIALLLPAIKKAKENARDVLCATNQRQIILALYTYSCENGGMGPAYRHDGTDSPSPGWSSSINWSEMLYGGKDVPGTLGSYFLTRNETPGKRKLNPYVGDWDVYRCPRDTGDAQYPGMDSDWEWFGTSYKYLSNWYGNFNFGNTDPYLQHPVFYGKPFDVFADQSQQVIIGDYTLQYAWPLWPMAPGPHGSHSMWHDPPENHPDAVTVSNVSFYPPLCNVGFLDGHVALIRLGPYEPGDFSANNERYIIDPDYWP